MQRGVSVPLGNEENESPAHEITLRAGTALSELLTFQLVNEEGGGFRAWDSRSRRCRRMGKTRMMLGKMWMMLGTM